MSTAINPKLLPVSILAGPSVRAFLSDMVIANSERRFGLVTSLSDDLQIPRGNLLIERLVTTNGGGHGPAHIKAQISGILEKALVDHLIIECDFQTHPIAFASLFLPDSSSVSFSETARLSSILVAVEARTLLNSLVHGEQAPGVISPCILADQIECADVVVLNDQPAPRDLPLARTVVSTLNPRARIYQSARETTLLEFLDTGLSFDFEASLAGAGWQKLMGEGANVAAGDQRVKTFVYRARRPFHPSKFWNLIQEPFPGVFRAKGFFWLATRMDLVGGLNIAGWECHHSPAGQWWAAHAHHQSAAEMPDRLKKEWIEPFGDRRQAIAFMGMDLDVVHLTAQLDACLLGESEMAQGESSWGMLRDPFPEWMTRTHSHECGEHDCCDH